MEVFKRQNTIEKAGEEKKQSALERQATLDLDKAQVPKMRSFKSIFKAKQKKANDQYEVKAGKGNFEIPVITLETSTDEELAAALESTGFFYCK